MGEPIDLTDDGSGTPLYITSDDGSKKRIIALAEGLDERLRVAEGPARKRVRTAVDGVELPAPAANAEMLRGRSASVAAAAKPTAPTSVAASPVPALGPPAAQAVAQPTNQLLAQLHAERLARMSEESKAAMRTPTKREAPKPATSGPSVGRPTAALAAGASTSQQRASTQPTASGSAHSLSVLSYNLWFDEDMHLQERMKAVSDIIEREGFPDLLLFQEVTQNMVLIFRQSSWFRRYHCSPVPDDKSYFTLLLARRDTVTLPAMQPWVEKDFDNSCMGRSILYTRAIVGGRPLVVGTTHLESPVGPGPQQMVAQRQEQLAVAVRELEAAAGAGGDVMLAGDLNWSDTRDGPVRTPPRWCDAWQALNPSREGCTWDPVANPMLTSHYKGSRLDRVLCRLSAKCGSSVAGATAADAGGGGAGGGWQLSSMKLMGTQALPGLSHEHKGKRLPVLPSDHFGLLLKLIPAGAALASAGVGRVLGSAASAAAATPSTSSEQPRAAHVPAAAAAGSSGRAGGAAAAAEPTSAASAAIAVAGGGDRDQAGARVKPKVRRLPRPATGKGPATAVPPPAAAAGAKSPATAAARPQQPATVDLSVEDDDDDVVVL